MRRKKTKQKRNEAKAKKNVKRKTLYNDKIPHLDKLLSKKISIPTIIVSNLGKIHFN